MKGDPFPEVEFHCHGVDEPPSLGERRLNLARVEIFVEQAVEDMTCEDEAFAAGDLVIVERLGLSREGRVQGVV
jgi:hypothetical protein